MTPAHNFEPFDAVTPGRTRDLGMVMVEVGVGVPTRPLLDTNQMPTCID